MFDSTKNTQSRISFLRKRHWLMFACMAGLATWLALLSPAFAQGPTVVSTDPITNEVAAPVDTDIWAMFDGFIDPDTLNAQTFVAHGMFTGQISGTYSLKNWDEIVYFEPDTNLFPGETIYTTLTDGLTDGSSNPINPFVWQFTTQTDGGGYIDSDNPVNIGSGTQAFDAAWADYDGDGDLDLAVAYFQQQSYVYPNNGDGTFGTGLTFGLATDNTYAVAWGDADNDGDPDLAVGINGAKNRFCRNQGTWFFCTTPMDDSLATYDVVWGDYNKDGNLDLAVANSLGQNYVYPGNGNGTFDAAVTFGTGTDTAGNIAWGDCNNDGYLDLAVANNYYEPSAVYQNDGSGGFVKATDIGVLHDNGSAVAWGDYDGDGLLDLAWGMNRSGPSPQGHSTIFPGKGNCTFDSGVEFGSDEDHTRSLAWGDYDGDGDLDLVAANLSGQFSAVYTNNGDGSMGSAVTFGNIDDATQSIALGDFTGDGNLDIVEANYPGQSYVFKNGNPPPPPELTDFNPTRNAVNAPLDSSVVLTYSAAMNASSVTSQTVAVFSMMQGMVTGAPSTNGSLVTVDPDDFFPGELVYAIATDQTADITGTHPVSATVWQFTAEAPQGHGHFDDTPVNFGTGSDATYSLAWADFNGDGYVDLAMGNYGQQNAVYPNNGDGSFGAPVNFGTGSDDTSSLAWGDFDADGDLDLAVGNYGQQNVIYPNNGNGSFGSGLPIGGATDYTYVVAWGDLEGDGDLDLAVANEGAQNVVYPNNGNGSFGAPVNFGTGVDLTYSLAWGDFNEDGYLDLAVGNAGLQNAVYPNNGNGSFGAPVNFGTGVDVTYNLAWADWDGDGDLDLAVANKGQNAVYPNNGNGSFGAAVDFGSGSDNTSGLAWGDFDADGNLDLAVSNASGQDAVYPNNGNGSFGAAVNFGSGSDPSSSLAWADFDSDGDLDIAVGHYGEQDTLWLNEPPPVPPELTGFSPERNALDVAQDSNVTVTYDHNMDPTSVTSHTVAVFSMQQGLVTSAPNTTDNEVIITPDSDFFPGELVYAVATTHTTDITGTNPISSAVWQFNAATSGGGQYNRTPVEVGGNDSETRCVAWGDFTGDGHLDLAVGNTLPAEGKQNVLYPNNGDGSFGAGINFGTGSDYTYALATGDFNGDGHLDLAVGNNSTQNVVYFNDGNGNLGSGENFGPGNDPTYTLAAVDFNGDGAPDLAVGNWPLQNYIYLNQGDGSFDSGIAFGPTNDTTYSLAAGDFDADGDIDLAVGNSANNQNKVYHNNGDGTFGSGVNLGPGNDNTLVLAAGDYDGNGNLDVAVGNSGQNAVYPGNGDGTFGSAVNFGPAGSVTVGLAWGDFDGDGDLDLIAGNSGQNAVYPNKGDGTFGSAVYFGPGDDSTYDLACGDFDGDGDLDVAVGNRSEQNTVWLDEPRSDYDLSITKAVEPGSVMPGDSITYTLAFSNTGPDAATGVVLTDIVPVSVTLQSVYTSGVDIVDTGASPAYVWDVDEIGAGQSGYITLTATLSDDLPLGSSFTNQATIYASNDITTTDNTAWAKVKVEPNVHQPQVGDTTTAKNTQTVAGLIIDRNPLDGAEVTHFQITDIQNGTLFHNDSITPISNDDFISVAQGQAGLKFTPDTGFLGDATFKAQSSVGSMPVGLGGDKATATINVVPGNVSQPVDPQNGGTLEYTGSGPGRPVTVTVEIPAGAVTQTLTLVYSETLSSAHPAPGGLDFAGQMFTLQAYLGTQLQVGLVFSQPVTIVLDYDPAALGGVDESTLELRYWDGTTWSTDGIVIVERDTVNHRLTVTIEHLTEFAMLGVGRGGSGSYYMPILSKETRDMPD